MMKRQRGLAAIAIYALLALGGLVALTGWWEYHNYTVRAAEHAKNKAALERCAENVKTATDANNTLRASTEKLLADVAAQNKHIEELRQHETAARKALDFALAAALKKEQMLRAEINRLTIIANAPPVVVTEQTCMAELSEIGGLLRSLLTEVPK